MVEENIGWLFLKTLYKILENIQRNFIEILKFTLVDFWKKY